MTDRIWLVVATICVMGLFPAAILAQKPDAVTSGDVKKQVAEALEKARQYTDEQRKAFQKKMEGELGDLSKRIADIKKDAQRATGEARKKLDSELVVLKQKQRAAEEELGKLKSASKGTWEDLKTRAQDAMSEARKAYEDAVKREKP